MEAENLCFLRDKDGRKIKNYREIPESEQLQIYNGR